MTDASFGAAENDGAGGGRRWPTCRERRAAVPLGMGWIRPIALDQPGQAGERCHLGQVAVTPLRAALAARSPAGFPLGMGWIWRIDLRRRDEAAPFMGGG